MKTIVCYGDSNTHGYDPRDGGRYAYAVRWPGRLQLLLGREEYYVVEEGLNARTTVQPDVCYDDNKSGVDLLPPILKTHMPVDLIAIMLGTNDMKLRFSMGLSDISRGAARLVSAAKTVSAAKSPDGKPCKVLLIAPPRITEKLRDGNCYAEFGDRAIALSAGLSPWYARVAQEHRVAFLDAATVVQPSDIDGLHLSPEGHALLAQAVADVCRELLAQP
ncbi:MAG: SGNH/GDSL hydrolase family protein [Eubacteriales bacterium]|nr:SGNH/GDSL hydrolase family protein [Eubacteriales bacterium]